VLVDYHTHTPLCAHALGEPAEYVQRAAALGLAEIGISEHSPWMIQAPDEKLAPTDEEFAQVVDAVQALQRRHNHAASPLHVRLGIEMDFVPSRLHRARDYLAKYPWDYVIGSIHHLEKWGIDNPTYRAEYERRDLWQIYEEYFAAVRQMAETGLFDTIGHVDVIKKFGYRPAGDLRPLYDQLARTFEETGVVVEINTSGRDKDAREFYPAPPLLDALARAGVPITLGSDAHRPREVGRYFAEARALLLSLGIDKIVAFEARQRRFIPL